MVSFVRKAAALSAVIGFVSVSAIAGPNDVCPLIFGGTAQHYVRDRVAMDQDAVHHILKGDVRGIEHARRTGEESEKIRGGIHTVAAMDEFLRMRPDVLAYVAENENRLVTTMPNGVIVVRLPQNAFTREQNESVRLENGEKITVGRKTLFPARWSESKIQTAIESIIKIGKEADDPSDGEFTLNGIHDGVRIRVVVIRGRQVITAYPTRDQPEPYGRQPVRRQNLRMTPVQSGSPLPSIREYRRREGF